MTTTKLDQRQLAELTRRAYQKARERRTEKAMNNDDRSEVDLDTAIAGLIDDHQQAGGIENCLIEADILAAYEEMNTPSLGQRTYHKLVSLALRSLGKWQINRYILYGTLIGLTGVVFTSDMIFLHYSASEPDSHEEVSVDNDMLQARKAIPGAYAETNEELRRLKLQNIVADFYEKRSDAYSSSALFDEAIANGVPANDLISIIDTVCPLPQEDPASCGLYTRVENNVTQRAYFTESALAGYAAQAHRQGKTIDQSLKALDEARQIIVEQHKAGDLSEPFSNEMPGLIINQAEKLLH